jgi:hypothetical protein
VPQIYTLRRRLSRGKGIFIKKLTEKKNRLLPCNTLKDLKKVPNSGKE